MKLNYIDIHSHLNLSPLLENKDQIINTLRENGVGTITVGTDYATSKLAVEMALENPDILWATVGMHPNDLPTGQAGNKDETFDYEKYLELAKNEKVVAIGECGLDYFRLEVESDRLQEEKQRQKELFIKHIEIAIETGKSLMIHARPAKNSMDAYEDVLDILETYNLQPKTRNLSVNFHFFVGDLEIAKKIVKNGWTMSFDGPITFTHDYDEVIKSIPIENIMAETDAPFATPVPYRGQTNYPQYVEFIYKKIAEIEEVSIDECKVQILNNVKRVFGLRLDD
jgi:TatD DNase family protein